MEIPSTSLTISATTDINATSGLLNNYYASSNLTAWTATFSNINNGAYLTIDYQKTTATNLVITFPASTIINGGSDAIIASNVATLVSTTSGRFTITISRINSVYKVYISQDIA